MAYTSDTNNGYTISFFKAGDRIFGVHKDGSCFISQDHSDDEISKVIGNSWQVKYSQSLKDPVLKFGGLVFIFHDGRVTFGEKFKNERGRLIWEKAADIMLSKSKAEWLLKLLTGKEHEND